MVKQQFTKNWLCNQDLTGTLENGKLASLAGTVQGPGGSYVIEASVVDNGAGYTITGSGALAAGPLEGSVTAQIETDPAFNIKSRLTQYKW